MINYLSKNRILLQYNKIESSLLIIIFILLIFGYVENFRWLFAKWMENPDYSHGPLIPIISIFMVFQKRHILKKLKKQGANTGLFFILGAILLRIVGLRGQVCFISSYSFILLIIGIVLFLYGKYILKEVLFPILFLIFMIPFWGIPLAQFSNILKLLSSKLSFELLSIMGYVIHKEGVILYLSKGTLEVADPCSGLRSLISLLALGSLIAYYSHGSFVRKSILVFSTIPLAFLANTIRIVFFGIFLEENGVLISEGFLHTLTGMCVFMFTLLGVISLKKCMKL